MNNFERMISDEFMKNHSMSLLRENRELMLPYEDEFDSEAQKDVFAHRELDKAIRDRRIYLAVREYHNCLSRFLAEAGISLPDLDTLVEKYHEE